MSIFNKIHDKIDDVVTDFTMDAFDKIEESIDLMDRRMQRRFKKAEENIDKIDIVFSKDVPIQERFNAVFPKKERLKRTCAEYGDILCVDRGIYQHYGIYIDNNRVIHYAGDNTDFSLKNLKDNTIREDDMNRFLMKNKEYFVVDCEAKSGIEIPFLSGKKLLIAYSPEETVARAKSKLGEKQYNLAINNCEHFAIWCKTGIYKSKQVDAVLNILPRIPIIIEIP